MTGDEDPPATRISAPALILGVALLGIAGFVDAAGFLAFGLFPSFRSGDTTQLGVALAQDRRASALLLGGMVAIFVAGAFLGRLLTLRTARRSAVLTVEAVLLALGGAAAHWRADAPALSIAVLAMGVQTATLTRAGSLQVGATYVTGTLARLGMGLADALAGTDRGSWFAYLLLWSGLAAGAAGGALCYGRVGLESLLFAAAACAVLAGAAGLVERRRGRG